MRLKERIAKVGAQISGVMRRFPVSCGFALALTLVLVVNIFTEEIAMELALSLGLGMLTAILAETAGEYGLWSYKGLLPAGAVTIACYLVLHFWQENDYVAMGYVGVGFMLPCFILALLYSSADRENLFPWLMQSAVYCVITTGVVFCGLLFCLLAFYFLLYQFKDLYKSFVSLFVTCEISGNVILFLSFIPHRDEELKVSSAYRKVIHNVLFYVYLLLIGILYLYIIKIIVTWTMPVGVLNWFGSFALLFYVFFALSVSGQDGEVQNWFHKYGAAVVLPVLLVQLYAIYIRLAAYGLTPLRYISLALIVIAIGFMICESLKLSRVIPFLAAAGVLMIITMTPFNALDVPNRSQERILREALERTGCFVDGQYHETQLSAEDIEIIDGALSYLRYADGTKSSYVEAVLDSPLPKILYQEKYNPMHYDYYSMYNLDSRTAEIKGYSEMELCTFKDADDVCGYDCTEYFTEYLKEKVDTGNYPGTAKLVTEDGNLLVFTEFSWEYNMDEKDVENVNGTVLLFRK
ncbi:MAG: DUF4153 domain-containing protein [Erysipelotrichaceae bacterium]|nr:DUF4153 domain-containing protein [Erysipelotrichaceae bacterium]